MDSLLELRNLEVRFALREGTVRAVDGVSLTIPPRETVGIVGESGCGKSITARAILRILPPGGSITRGEILLSPRNGKAGEKVVDIARLDPHGREMRRIRGGEIALIFQEPMTSLSPVHSIGDQIGETVRIHQGLSKRDTRHRAIEMLKLVGVPMAEKRVSAYPHELSGGLRQRCMIAMALASNPRLLIADEPTTALDVTIQAQILNLIEQLQAELGMAVLIITHDLGVIAETADEVAVMYLGKIVEQGPVAAVLQDPKHPYTKGLLASVPRLGKGNRERLAAIPGSVPAPFTIISGCPFHPRCPERILGVCEKGEGPRLLEEAPSHSVACHLYPSQNSAGVAEGVRE